MMTPRETRQRIKATFWTTKEVAETCGVSEWTVQQWVQSGKIESVEIGVSRYVPGTNVLGYYKEALDHSATSSDTIALVNGFALKNDPQRYAIVSCGRRSRISAANCPERIAGSYTHAVDDRASPRPFSRD